MLVYHSPEFDHHERVHFFHDRATGLRAIIALHRSRPRAAGGIRMKPYANETHAVDDALRLSRAMTYKWALTGLPPGGAKTVVIGDPSKDKTKALLHALGHAIDQLNGAYIGGSDVGTSDADMRVIQEVTPHVRGADPSHGDSSEATAYGVYQGMRAALDLVFAQDTAKGLRVAVQGLGHVGEQLCLMLSAAGAKLYVSDIDLLKARAISRKLDATVLTPDEILRADVDVLAPCALGGILDEKTAGEVRAKVVCGAANNQLAHSTAAEILHNRGILFAPDYVVNAGGVINGSAEGEQYDRAKVWKRLDRIRERSAQVFAHARARNISSQRAADEIAAAIIAEREK